MVSLCQYKHIFGKEKEGVHSYRFFNIAIVDTLLTFILSLAISYYFKINLIFVFVLLVILSIIIHRIFCVNTTLTKMFLKN